MRLQWDSVLVSWFLEHRGVFTNAQCGFRKHRSAVDHILALDTEVRVCFSQKKHLGAIFFDIEAAYDTVPRHGILKVECLLTSAIWSYGHEAEVYIFLNLPFPSNPKENSSIRCILSTPEQNLL